MFENAFDLNIIMKARFFNEFSFSFSFKRVTFLAFSKSTESVDFLKSLSQTKSSLFVDIVSNVSIKNTKRDISKFVLKMILWYETKNIIRKNYASLKKILNVNQFSIDELLSIRLFTLLQWKREKLLISILHKIQISILTKKQSFKIFDNTTILYYLNFRVLIVMFLNIENIFNRVHFEMIEIVKNLKKLWHFNAWNFSIRTCSNDYVKYKNETSIIFSNFIEYENTSIFHIVKIIFFDKNFKTTFTNDIIIFRIQKVVFFLFKFNQIRVIEKSIC